MAFQCILCVIRTPFSVCLCTVFGAVGGVFGRFDVMFLVVSEALRRFGNKSDFLVGF